MGPALPIGRVLALVGGLCVLAAYAMPWLGVQVQGQGIVLSGQFLGRFLGSTNDLRQFLPGAVGGPAEVQQLRAVVLLFPIAGALLAAVALATAWRWRFVGDALLIVGGLVPLGALAAALTRLPPTTVPELGLWTIAGGAVAVVLGGAVDLVFARRAREVLLRKA